MLCYLDFSPLPIDKDTDFFAILVYVYIYTN